MTPSEPTTTTRLLPARKAASPIHAYRAALPTRLGEGTPEMSKIMTLRLDDAQSASLEMISRADGKSMTDTVRTAIERHIEARRGDQDFQDRLADILREDREIIERLSR